MAERVVTGVKTTSQWPLTTSREVAGEGEREGDRERGLEGEKEKGEGEGEG